MKRALFAVCARKEMVNDMAARYFFDRKLTDAQDGKTEVHIQVNADHGQVGLWLGPGSGCLVWMEVKDAEELGKALIAATNPRT